MGRSRGPKELELGHVVGTFGVRGELKVFLHHPDSDLLRTPRKVMLLSPDGHRRPVTLSIRPGSGKRILGRVDGVATPEEAESLTGFRIVIDAAELPAPGDDEFYLYQVLDAAVVVDGRTVGKVVDVHYSQDMDVLVIETPQGQEFIPCESRSIERLDPHGGEVWLRPGVLSGDVPPSSS